MKKPPIATILYNPDNSTYERIKSAIDFGYEVYIFDNSPDLNSKLFVSENKNKVRYFTYDRNVGIGPALRLICSTAFDNGSEHLLFFDQDTIFTEETLNFIIDYLSESSVGENSAKSDKFLSVTFRDAVINRKRGIIEQAIIGKYSVNVVDFTISSGTLFSLKNLKNIGWHDESFKVDGVDYAICISAESNGLKIAEISNTPGLDHETNQGNKIFRFMFKTYSGRKYSLFRIRDYIYSSLRLAVKSFKVNKKNTLRILMMLFIYIFQQIIFRISIEIANEK
jgi:rhamnosyltransferase